MKEIDGVKKEIQEAASLDNVVISDKPVGVELDSDISLDEADDIFERSMTSMFEQEPLNKIESAEINMVDDIFDCNEEDFTFDQFEFDEDTLQELLEQFDDSNWYELDAVEKEQVLKEYVTFLARELGIPNPPRVQFYYGEYHEYGYYNGVSNTVNFNLAHLDNPIATLDTAAHETWHAFQQFKADHPTDIKDLQYKINFENYISPNMSFEYYESQLVEAEARAFANYMILRTVGDFE